MNSLEVWKDKLILHWDGVLPPGTPTDAIYHKDDVTYFWKELKGFVKHNKKFNAFLLSFSKQNLRRLEAQFGPLPVRRGRERIAELEEKARRFSYILETSKKTKSLPIERLPTYNYKSPPLNELQHRCNVYLCNVRRGALFIDCGLGKTFIVLTSTERQINLGMIQRGKTLICGKLATLETGWMEDAAKFTNLRLVNLWLPQQKNRHEKIRELLNTPADAYLINHDGVRVFKDALVEKNFEKVVVDESTILKGFHGTHAGIKGGQFGRALLEVAHRAEWRVIMSGTPAPNGPQDLWGQMHFLDPEGFLLEPDFHDYHNDIMEVIDLRPSHKRYYTDEETKEKVFVPLKMNMPHKWIPRQGAIQKVSDLIEPLCFRAKIRDHLTELPELTIMKRKIIMDKEQEKHYRDMDKRLRVELDDTRITVPVKIAQIMKLRQISGGFIIDNQEQAHALPRNPKVDELDSLIEDEIGDNKLIIYAQYRWEIEMLQTRYKALSVYGGNQSSKNLENIQLFLKDEMARIIIMHPQSAAHGITLTNAHYMVFYAINHSSELNYQAIRRILRAGQKHPMFVYYLLAASSIDEKIYQVLETKDKNQEELLNFDQLLLKTWSIHE